MNDPIVDEVRSVRDAHAASFNYDLRAIFMDIKQREKERGLNFVDGIARQPVPNKTLHQTGAATAVSSDHQVLPPARRLSFSDPEKQTGRSSIHQLS